jgi:hypothetical protein
MKANLTGGIHHKARAKVSIEGVWNGDHAFDLVRLHHWHNNLTRNHLLDIKTNNRKRKKKE